MIAVTTPTLLGKSEAHLCSSDDVAVVGAPVHAAVVEPFRQLRAAAMASGFELAVTSGFRSFERQLSIWNRKATGTLPVLDSTAEPMKITALTGDELAFAILRWSALPGASRHHWGTDIDIYDLAATPAGYEVELVPAEVEHGGMFAPLHHWLDARIADGTAFGFYRPYDIDRGGVAPERWHLSYSPIASECARLLTPDLLRTTIGEAGIMLKDVVLARLTEIFDRFVANVNRADA